MSCAQSYILPSTDAMHIEQEKNITRAPLSFKQGLFMGFLFLFFAAALVFVHSLQFAYAQESYKLPYPGILPNHPLYRIKEFRDNLLERLTRDPIKKVELHLLFADKKIAAAQFLADNHKDWELSGLSLEVSLAERVRKVGPIHAAIIKNLRKNAPKKNKQAFTDALSLNGKFSKWAKTQ
jgi:hypothetical protein